MWNPVFDLNLFQSPRKMFLFGTELNYNELELATFCSCVRIIACSCSRKQQREQQQYAA